MDNTALGAPEVTCLPLALWDAGTRKARPRRKRRLVRRPQSSPPPARATCPEEPAWRCRRAAALGPSRLRPQTSGSRERPRCDTSQTPSSQNARAGEHGAAFKSPSLGWCVRPQRGPSVARTNRPRSQPRTDRHAKLSRGSATSRRNPCGALQVTRTGHMECQGTGSLEGISF